MDRNQRAAAQGSAHSRSQNQGPGRDAFPDRSRILAWREERNIFHLKISGNLFIKQFLYLLTRRQLAENITKQYMGKVLHAVFFFGRLNQRQVTPSDFLEPESFRRLQEGYRQSFEEYHTHLPSLTPYSILLQFGNEVEGCSTQQEMESFLCEFNSAVQTMIQRQAPNMRPSEFTFGAAVVAYSFYREPRRPQNEDLPLFYGASLSCKGWIEKNIMISILCLRTWHKAVAFAVYHGQDSLAIVFPDGVQCRAFRYSDEAFIEKPPCVNCKMMYHVDFRPYEGDNRENVSWPHGNCAENECLSKLLQGVPGLQERVVSTDTSVINNPPQNTYQAIEREFANTIETHFTDRLIRLLRNKGFPLSLQFFEPQ